VIRTLLGKLDFPTDAVEDYCRLLGGALGARGCETSPVRVPWERAGRVRALIALTRASSAWKDDWVLVQYTALMWSRFGFPLFVLLVLCILRINRARIAVVFHDTEPYGGNRARDRARRTCQRVVMYCAHQLSDHSILTVPRDHITWLSSKAKAVSFIPVGSNLPALGTLNLINRNKPNPKTVVIFSLSSASVDQVVDLAVAVKSAAVQLGELHLLMLGRTMAGAEAKIREILKDSRVEVSCMGLLSPDEVSQNLLRADIFIFTRGVLTTNRGSAIAAIASGLPVVAYGQPEPNSPLAEAGVLFVPYGDRAGIARGLVELLTDDDLWMSFHHRNLYVFERYFSWPSIADRYLELFGSQPCRPAVAS
jgi:glycosyltransferase involved in cell wall biosynthesis